MSLRNRVALAGGAVVLAALVMASLVLYPSLGTKLIKQYDATLVAAVQQAPDTVKTIKAKSAATGIKPPFFTGKPVDVGSTRLQLLAAPVTPGPSPGFIAVSNADQQVAAGIREPYFQDAEYGGVRYRVYTAPLPGAKGVLVRAAMPTSVVGAPSAS